MTQTIMGVKFTGREKDIDGKCGRCKGTGYVNYNYDNGTCFWCDGHKSVAKYKDFLFKRQEKRMPLEIQEREEEIARLKKNVERFKNNEVITERNLKALDRAEQAFAKFKAENRI